MREKVKIADVARVSGVSRATIDRVINNRAGVKDKTRQQVVNALETLGYAPDALSYLKGKRAHDLRFFLLDGTNPFFAEIRSSFMRVIQSLAPLGVHARRVDFDPYDPSTLQKALNQPDQMTAAIVAVGADTPGTNEAIGVLRDKGIPVITVISDMPNSARNVHIGQDNEAAGRTAGRLMASMLPRGSGTIGMLVGHSEFRHLTERSRGFAETLRQLRPELKLVTTSHYGGSNASSAAIVKNLFSSAAELRGVYLAGGGQPDLIDALATHRKQQHVVIGHELSPRSQLALQEGTFQALVAHNMDEVARMATEAALACTTNPNVAFLSENKVSCGVNVYVPENLPVAHTTGLGT